MFYGKPFTFFSNVKIKLWIPGRLAVKSLPPKIICMILTYNAGILPSYMMHSKNQKTITLNR